MTAQRYRVDDDRWGNRWLFTPFWMVRCDVAERLGTLPWKQPPGVYVAGKRVEKHDVGRGCQRVLRLAMQGKPEPLTFVDYMGEGRVGQVAQAFARPDGRLVYIDVALLRKSVWRLPESVRLFQFHGSTSHAPHLGPVVANLDGQPVGVVMPLRLDYGPVWVADIDTEVAA